MARMLYEEKLSDIQFEIGHGYNIYAKYAEELA
jgi:hypothetical protein